MSRAARTGSYVTPGTTDEYRLVSALMETVGRLENELDVAARRSHGVSLAQVDILLTIARADSNRLRMADLARALVVSRAGTTYRIDVLERRGLVVRVPSDIDQRETYVELTANGWRLMERAVLDQHTMLTEILFSHLKGEELPDLASLLERVLVTLRQRPERGRARP